MTSTSVSAAQRAVLLAALLAVACGPSGAPDAGSSDAGSSDAGTADAGSSDAGTADAGAEDASPPDAGPEACEVSPEPDCGYRSAETFAEMEETAEFILATSVAGRELPGLVRYPRGATGPLPVVVFAHAGSWSRTGHDANREWSRALVRAGYAVVRWSVVMPTEAQLREICMLVGVNSQAECDDHTVLGGGQPNPFSAIVVARAHDPAAILDNFDAIAAHVLTETGAELDGSRVALAGWSGGAQAVMQSAGAVREVTETITYELPDERFDAFVALSPQYAPDGGFFDGAEGSSWDAVRGPMLFVTGDGDDKLSNGLTGPLRRMAFERIPAGEAALFYATLGAEQVEHNTFNLEHLGSGEPALAQLSRAMVMLVHAHLDANLRGHAPAQQWLASRDPIAAASGHAEWVTP